MVHAILRSRVLCRNNGDILEHVTVKPVTKSQQRHAKRKLLTMDRASATVEADEGSVEELASG